MNSTSKHHHKLLINIPAVNHNRFLSTKTLQSVKMRSTLSTSQNLPIVSTTITKTEPSTVRNKKTISLFKKPKNLKLSKISTKYKVKKEFDKLYGLNDNYYKTLSSLRTEQNLSLSEHQSKLLSISSNLSRDHLLKLYTEFKTIKASTEIVKPLPPVNFKKLIAHSKKEYQRKKGIEVKGRKEMNTKKEELDEFEVEMEKCKINSKRRLKKEDPAMVKAFSVLPEYLVDLLVKKKGKLS